ncbi:MULTISPECIES: heavy metal-binding domain-containing protein [Shewanella]|uniref:heavy metal-binding domain-containing protein n=1 Tax=Shewanella TaxID=22 RepID=UPI001C65E83A|nr:MULTISPECIES: heavy metal-binding domain-containing protein [Shewanella]QYJ75226.1 ATPase P [Shewanella sp. FJAT-52076]QYK05097.1 ATPase P [Shewanella zhangzhouensis]
MKTLIGLFLAALLSVTLSVGAQATPAHEHHAHQATAAEASHACPMHPEVTGKAGDSCPKCGMDLEAKHTHACPMHPKVTGAAGDSCPDCGMDLEPVAAQGEHCANCPKKAMNHQHH